ncbi:succinate dehydrogenase/fumarate reductase flavoprotein subunit [Rivularia sp. PCC 7116]|uniref:FAD-dependent oxidoreductase n=1 Tax=Rivularia sp. PCC 7116 TaxID=373994 RepID=UPI00029EE1BC|nr:FAD-dependent oxidoreductase [Rivularia sp. PCC 7116]AFY55742.1 succinate dehydrogenase/fumarate reductase flavoprotein subunit [Rivularia sp. PCC 7116]
MENQIYTTDVLVVGGGTGGTTAAIQAARRGAKTILVSEFPWLGGMLTSAGVCAPDGNELEAFQTGIWGDYLKELQQRQPGGLDNCWASLFSYHPQIGAQIFADWVAQLTNLQWFWGQVPLEVLSEDNCVKGVRFADFIVEAKITLDGTELGDLLALADIPFRWGWELQSEFNEPSAPVTHNSLTAKYPVQAPTWVVIMQDYCENLAPAITPASNYDSSLFAGAWDDYGAEKFLNYGSLGNGLLMINWPNCGNDYGEGLGRLVESEQAKSEFLYECRNYSQNFAHFIQSSLGRRYGLADNVFPTIKNHSGAFAFHPYYRESRRLVGLTTVKEQDILPVSGTNAAPLYPDSIAIGNYPNDHHYPGVKFELQPKSIRWGGRVTGTPFSIPYGCLVPAKADGLLVCEKNISVSHIANGATRLQPVVMNIAQAAGMAAAMCIELNIQPRNLPVRALQQALLNDARSPAAIVPLFNSLPSHPDWLKEQLYYLDNLHDYIAILTSGSTSYFKYSYGTATRSKLRNIYSVGGIFQRVYQQNYRFIFISTSVSKTYNYQLIALSPTINKRLCSLQNGSYLSISGSINHAANWLLVEHITKKTSTFNLE